jgi:hypothetical protein
MSRLFEVFVSWAVEIHDKLSPEMKVLNERTMALILPVDASVCATNQFPIPSLEVTS